MTGALRYEVMRIRTIASSYWMSGIAIALTAGISLLIATTVSSSNFTEVGITNAVVTNIAVLGGGALPAIPILSAAFMAVLGSLAMGHEYRYGTNKATLSAIPDRTAVLAAKVIVLVVWVAAVVAAVVVVDSAVAWLFMDHVSFGSTTVRPVLAYLLYCEGFAVVGFGLASVFRNQTGAIVGVLVWPYVIEPIIYGILAVIAARSHPGVGKLTNLLPASAGRRTMFDPYSVWSGFQGSVDTWALGPSFLVFAAGVVVALTAGCVLFVTRDA
jgi:ABC-type transport system involved in multi-copper enzyme maturation permease subunit